MCLVEERDAPNIDDNAPLLFDVSVVRGKDRVPGRNLVDSSALLVCNASACVPDSDLVGVQGG